MGVVEDKISTLLGDVLLKPADEGYEAELDAIAEIRSGLEPAEAVELIGYVYGRPSASSRVAARVDQAGSTHLADWASGELLSQKLAGCAAIQLLELDDSSTAVAAALATASARLLGDGAILPELDGLSEAALARLADARRSPNPEPRASVQPFPPRTKASELPPDDGGQVTNAILRGYMEGYRNAVRAAASVTSQRLLGLERTASRTSEEVDLLWWSLAPDSIYVDDWETAGNSATLVAAFEVSARLLTDPPARGARRLIVQALTSARAQPTEVELLGDVAASLPSTALERLGSHTPGLWATPVLDALARRQLGTEESEATDTTLSARRTDWALQLIREQSLTRVLSTAAVD